MHKITVEFKFPMGHRLPNHKGGCFNLHGHNYKLQLTLKGNVVSEAGAPDEGMIVDFSAVKALVKEYIDEHFDHAFMVHENDTAVKNFLLETGYKTTVVPFIPTAENMAKAIYDDLNKMLNVAGTYWVHEVKLWETDSSFASYSI